MGCNLGKALPNCTGQCRGADSRARRNAADSNGPPLKWQRLPDLSLRGRFAPVAISGRQLRFRRKCPIIRPSTARFPRRFAPRNDKPEGPAPLNQWRKYCCSPRRSGNTATFFSRAAASPPGLFPFTALHIIENYGIFSVKILTKKLRGDMLDLSEGTTCQTFNWNGRRKCP